MKRKRRYDMKKMALTVIALVAASAAAGDMNLPQPVTRGGKTLMQTLSERKSSRDFISRELSPQTLSSLLWAANGINRAD
jgi:hypothetical protein